MKNVFMTLVLLFINLGSMTAQIYPTIEDAFISGVKHNTELEPTIGPTTIMEFEQEVFEFGQIQEGDIVKNVFIFKNIGKEPLIISSAKGSCGCTVPEYSKDPIMPGESGMLLAIFDSKAKSGQMSKRITVVANTDPTHTFLNIKGEVLSESSLLKKSKTTEMKANKIQSLDANLFTVFPNPTVSTINVKMEEYIGAKGQISIVNNTGLTVIQKQIEEISHESYAFDVLELPIGIYTAIMKVGDKMSIAKQFVISR